MRHIDLHIPKPKPIHIPHIHIPFHLPSAKKVNSTIEHAIIQPVKQEIIKPVYRDIIKPLAQLPVEVTHAVIRDTNAVVDDAGKLLQAPTLLLVGAGLVVFFMVMKK